MSTDDTGAGTEAGAGAGRPIGPPARQTPARIRLWDVVRAEVTKIITLPAVWIALVLTGMANILPGWLIATDSVRLGGDARMPVAELGSLRLCPVYVFVAIAVLADGSEYRGGQLRVSLSAVPARHR